MQSQTQQTQTFWKFLSADSKRKRRFVRIVALMTAPFGAAFAFMMPDNSSMVATFTTVAGLSIGFALYSFAGLLQQLQQQQSNNDTISKVQTLHHRDEDEAFPTIRVQ